MLIFIFNILDTNAHSISLSESTYNEGSFYSQTITCSSHLSLQISHTKNSSWYSSSTLVPHTVDSLPKSSTPLLSLQMLVDNRQLQTKNKTEKKDFLESALSTDTSNIYPKVCEENETHGTLKNVDKVENDNIFSSRLTSNECHLLDSNVSVTSMNLLSSIQNKNSNIYIHEKDSTSKTVSSQLNINKNETNFSNHDKLNNSKISQNVLIFSPDITIEKVNNDKKESEIVKDIDCSTTQSKSVSPKTIALLSKLDRNVKDNFQEIFCDTKRRTNEINVKSTKNFIKRRKGVDSLLEKLESCSKRLHSDNLGSSYTTNIDEKEISIRSTSPEYYKSRSPNRDDDVISPTFSNDDSNDTKQRRKRKLGKPVRLSKELKLENEFVEFEILKPKIRIKSENSNSVNKILISDNSSISCTQTNTIRTELEIEKRSYVNINLSKHYPKLDKEVKIKSCNVEEIFNKKDNNKKQSNDHYRNDLLEKKNFKLSMRQYLINALKDTRCSRNRSSSECSVSLCNINRKKRRKSCDDVRNLLHESIAVSTVSNNVTAFNEVESQLEKMFAGIIETDKDLLKKTSSESEKSITLLSNEEQKENFNCGKVASKIISKNISSEATTNNNNFKNNKKKNISKIRTHKKKSNSNKDITDLAINNLYKDKLKHYNDKRHIKKDCILKKKKKCFKISTLREIICDSSNNMNPTKYKGPIIQIKGSKKSSLHFQIVNVPREDDEERSKERRKTIGNGSLGRSKRLFFQNNLDYRGKLFYILKK
jgi:hypothetical protein